MDLVELAHRRLQHLGNAAILFQELLAQLRLEDLLGCAQASFGLFKLALQLGALASRSVFNQGAQDEVLLLLGNLHKETLQELSGVVTHEGLGLLLLAACLCEAQDRSIRLYLLNVPAQKRIVRILLLRQHLDRCLVRFTQAEKIGSGHVLDHPLLEHVKRFQRIGWLQNYALLHELPVFLLSELCVHLSSLLNKTVQEVGWKLRSSLPNRTHNLLHRVRCRILTDSLRDQ